MVLAAVLGCVFALIQVVQNLDDDQPGVTVIVQAPTRLTRATVIAVSVVVRDGLGSLVTYRYQGEAVDVFCHPSSPWCSLGFSGNQFVMRDYLEL